MILSPGDRIERWDEGCRRFTIVKVGRRGVVLLDTTGLHTSAVGMKELLDDPWFRVVESNPRTIRRLIKANLAERRKLGLRSAVAAAKTVLQLLETRT